MDDLRNIVNSVNREQVNSTDTSLLAAALEYAEKRGWPVFPCIPGTKQPATPNGHKAATTNEEQIRAWWSINPNFNIGFAFPPGWCAIDADTYKPEFDQANLDALNLPSTYEQLSPRGGRHFIFRGDLRNTQADKLGKGIDTRAPGGYILLAPSRTEHGEYRKIERKVAHLPPHIAPLLEQPRQSADVEQDTPFAIMRGRQYLHEQVARGNLGVEGQGSDSLTFKLLAHLCGDLNLSAEVAGDLLLEEWNPHNPQPFEEDWIRGKCENAAKYHQNDGSSEAIPPSEKFDVEKIRKAQEKAKGEEKAEEKARQPGLPAPATFGQVVARNVPPIQELIPGFLEKGISTMLAGPGGVHKSRLALQWGLCFQAGSTIFGHNIEKAHFVYLSYEDSANNVALRSQAIAKKLDLPAGMGGSYFDLSGNEEHPEPYNLLKVSEDKGIERQVVWHDLAAHLKGIEGHKFVVLDSTYNAIQFIGTSKINEGLVMGAVRSLDGLCRQTNSTLVYLWHPSQAGQDRGDASGWSVAWHNAPRAKLSLGKARQPKDESTLPLFTLKTEKRSEAPGNEKLTLIYQEGALVVVADAGAKVVKADPATQDNWVYDAVVAKAIELAAKGTPFSHRRDAIDEKILKSISRGEKGYMREVLTSAQVRTYLKMAGEKGDLVDYSAAGAWGKAGWYGPKSEPQNPPYDGAEVEKAECTGAEADPY